MLEKRQQLVSQEELAAIGLADAFFIVVELGTHGMPRGALGPRSYLRNRASNLNAIKAWSAWVELHLNIYHVLLGLRETIALKQSLGIDLCHDR